MFFMKNEQEGEKHPLNGPSLWSALVPYRSLLALLVALTAAANGLNLALPKMIAGGIDAFAAGHPDVARRVIMFVAIAAGIFLLAYLQSIVQTFASERVARDLRRQLFAKISELEYAALQEVTSAKLLTNLTTDIDAVKYFVAQGFVTMVSSVVFLVGASAMLLSIHWKLALVVLLVVPIVGALFFTIFSRVRKLFGLSAQAVDRLNKIINESILGSALIRLLNAEQVEYQKFMEANARFKEIGLSILRLFATLIPVVGFTSNMATTAILVIGGHFVITNAMTVGAFTAFNSYLTLLVFPILVLGFVSNVIAQAAASHGRIQEVMQRKQKTAPGKEVAPMRGDLVVSDVSVKYGEKMAVKNVSFVAKAGTKTAIVGPTAAGKTQLLYVMTGLVAPTEGEVRYAGKPIAAFEPTSLHERIAFVFQDSIIFNMSLKENIAFSKNAREEDVRLAIETAELADFIETLPEKLDTVVSERGTSLSGGQKQRVMLARALALRPSVLLLDDFTARVDLETERRILRNVERNYPGMTVISVTQKIGPIESYDQIIVLMEGELLAKGTHEELLKTCPEYVQMNESQQSTSQYELQAE